MSVAIPVASALGAGEKTEKGMVRECIKAVKFYKMPKTASQVLMVSPSQCCSAQQLELFMFWGEGGWDRSGVGVQLSPFPLVS